LGRGIISAATSSSIKAALHRHPDARAQAAERTVPQRDVAAVRSRNIARDGETQPGATLVLVAGIVEPQKGFEHIVTHAAGNARPVVVHSVSLPAMIAMERHDD